VRFLAQAYNVKFYVGRHKVKENVFRGHINNVIASNTHSIKRDTLQKA